MLYRKPILLLNAILIAGFSLAASAERIGSVNYRFKWLGPSDKILVEAFDDPDVPGVTCYLSRANTGGIKGAVGLAEDPSTVSISCRQIGSIDKERLAKLDDGDEVFSTRASAVFKTTQVVRFYDEKRGVLVYLTYSDRIVEGSPESSISVVAVSSNR